MVNARFKKGTQGRQQLNDKNQPSKVPVFKIAGSIFFLALVSAVFLSFQIFLGLENNDNNSSQSQLPEEFPPHPDAVATIGYFISITSCGNPLLIDGAAVLKHSIHLASVRGDNDLGGKYDYRAHALYVPDAKECVAPLAELGYHLVERPVPVKVQDIQGDFLRSRIESNGCCGSKELLKLEAYTFTQYPVVVHMDIDAILLKPLDPLFDAMIGINKNTGDSSNDALRNIEMMPWPERPMPSKINAFFTRDYEVVNFNIHEKPVQGGLLVLRPDKAVYEEHLEVLKKGDFREGKGWGGIVGPFYGAMTIQGLLPYYYDILHPGQSVDLNHCVYNQMANNPTDKPTIKDVVQGRCRTGQKKEDCEDCRSRPLEDIVSTHFTICQKPWFCIPFLHNQIEARLCRKLVGEWYRIRSSMELSWGRSGKGDGVWKDSDHFFGYCSAKDKENYVPIEKPYGKVAAKV